MWDLACLPCALVSCPDSRPDKAPSIRKQPVPQPDEPLRCSSGRRPRSPAGEARAHNVLEPQEARAVAATATPRPARLLASVRKGTFHRAVCFADASNCSLPHLHESAFSGERAPLFPDSERAKQCQIQTGARACPRRPERPAPFPLFESVA